MNLNDLGFNEELSSFIRENNLTDFSVGRITQEHRERYVVSTGDLEYDAEITGNMRFTATSRKDFPAVGDWVTMNIYDTDQAIIHHILPRKSMLARQAIGKPGEIQIISTNIDFAFIVQAISNNFNINRLERYLTICNSSNIEPVFVISKIDLATGNEIRDAISTLEARDKNVKYILLSNISHEGLDQIMDFIQKEKTYCMVGSSGVGKSTLINNLLKKEVLRTGEISHSTNKGRHITEHRELFILENGGIIIDTPGMKELGITDDLKGIESTFEEIHKIAGNCKYSDCQHINEKGCAVLEALKNGSINKESYENYRKILKEQERYQMTVAEKRKRDKVFGKMLKNYSRDMKKNNPET